MLRVRSSAAAVALVVVLAALPPVARAQPYYGPAKAVFAQLHRVSRDAVVEAKVFVLPGVADYTHVMRGKYRVDDEVLSAVFLLRCGARSCSGTRVLGASGDRVSVLAVVDLEGKPASLDGNEPPTCCGGAEWDTALPSPGKRLRWPALVITTLREEASTGRGRDRKQVSGTSRWGRLLLVSLRGADTRDKQLVLTAPTQEIGASGAGRSTSYRTERGKQRSLDVIAREQRHLDRTSRCKEPAPIEYKLVLKDGRYTRLDDLAQSRGCH
ncbi:MAG: hypothetical protein IT370_28555 [Deltaproteobacteria bacterium]|nr:hypothetical protein [Deltaproteobacteria bacterium]